MPIRSSHYEPLGMILSFDHNLPSIVSAIGSMCAFVAASVAAVFAGLTYRSAVQQTTADRLNQFRLKTARVSQRRLKLMIQHSNRDGRDGVKAQIEVIRPGGVKIVRQKDWQTDGSGRPVRTEMMWPLASVVCTVKLEASAQQEDTPETSGWLSSSVFLIAPQALNSVEIRVRLLDENSGLTIASFSRRLGN
jgi:hypothetical protein